MTTETLYKHDTNPLSDFAEIYKPVTTAFNGFNEFYSINYFNYNPNVGRVDPKWYSPRRPPYQDGVGQPATGRVALYGGGLLLNHWCGENNDGYIPLLDMQTTELSGTCFLELNKKNMAKMSRSTPNLLAYLEHITQCLWEAQTVRESLFLNWYTRKPDTVIPREFFGLAHEVKHNSQSVVLVLELGQEATALPSKVISINIPGDWGYVWYEIPMPTMGGWDMANREAPPTGKVIRHESAGS